MENTNFSHMYDKFLVRGLPVIVDDATKDVRTSQNLTEFIDDVSTNMSEMRKQTSCELETNIMMSRYASVDEVFRVLELNEAAPWYLSFRNCRLQAVEFWIDHDSSINFLILDKSLKIADEETLLLPSHLASAAILVAAVVTELRKLLWQAQGVWLDYSDTAQRKHQSQPLSCAWMLKHLQWHQDGTARRGIFGVSIGFVDTKLSV